MPPLTSDVLTVFRRQVADGVTPITWDKPTINAAFQDTDDVLQATGFAASTFVTVTTTTDPRAQNVKTALDAGQIASNLVPVVEDWLQLNPPSVTTRSVDVSGIQAFVAANRPAFAAAVSAMPSGQRVKVIRLAIRRRVEAVV